MFTSEKFYCMTVFIFSAKMYFYLMFRKSNCLLKYQKDKTNINFFKDCTEGLWYLDLTQRSYVPTLFYSNQLNVHRKF